MNIYGKEVEIIKENSKELVVSYGGMPLTIRKEGGWDSSDTRYITSPKGNFVYEDIGFILEDGIARSNGIGNICDADGNCYYEKEDGELYIHRYDLVETKFPTIREIMTDKRKFNKAWSYMDEMCCDFEDYLMTCHYNIDLTCFFEGYFFNSSLKYKVNDKNSAKVAEIYEKMTEGYDVPSNFTLPCMEKLLHSNGENGEIALSGDTDSVFLSAFFPTAEDPSYSCNKNITHMSTEDIDTILSCLRKKDEIKKENVQLNNADNIEKISVRLDKYKTPIAYANKVKELMFDTGMTLAEAEHEVDTMEFDLELYYHIGYGLFGVESEAVECTPQIPIYSPYNGKKCDAYDE